MIRITPIIVLIATLSISFPAKANRSSYFRLGDEIAFAFKTSPDSSDVLSVEEQKPADSVLVSCPAKVKAGEVFTFQLTSKRVMELDFNQTFIGGGALMIVKVATISASKENNIEGQPATIIELTVRPIKTGEVVIADTDFTTFSSRLLFKPCTVIIGG